MIAFVTKFFILFICNYMIFTENKMQGVVGYTLLEVYLLFLLDYG
jgi:hypothetical protein